MKPVNAFRGAVHPRYECAPKQSLLRTQEAVSWVVAAAVAEGGPLLLNPW